MLSLLSLLMASGTVLRADTEQWTPLTYPNPRTNYTECNTWSNSTLCDPDHILTDQWREEINNNMNKLMEKLRRSPMEYTERAPNECFENTTVSVQLYVILAKRIYSTNNQTIGEADLTKFGDGLVEEFGLRAMPCKNFMIFIGVEAAKMAYVRTGSDLKLPPALMEQIFNQYNLFKAKNFMEVLNKIVNTIGEKISDPPMPSNKTQADRNETLDIISQLMMVNESISNQMNFTSEEIIITPTPPTIPWWMILLSVLACIIALIALAMIFQLKTEQRHLHRLKDVIIRHRGAAIGTLSSDCPSTYGSEQNVDMTEDETSEINRRIGIPVKRPLEMQRSVSESNVYGKSRAQLKCQIVADILSLG